MTKEVLISIVPQKVMWEQSHDLHAYTSVLGKSGRIYLQRFLKCTLQLRDVDTKVSFVVEHFHHLLIVDICWQWCWWCPIHNI